MSIDEIQTEALKLEPQARARLAQLLLESLEDLSAEENLRLWAAEADRRDSLWEAETDGARSADQVFQDSRARLGK